MQLSLALSLCLCISATAASIVQVFPGQIPSRSNLPNDQARSVFPKSRRAQPNSEAQFGSIQDPQQECQPYGLDELTQMQHEQLFPKDWQVAGIMDNDSDAKQVWQDIQNSGVIPSNVQVKTANNETGDFMGVATSGYNTSSDPDCWWTATTCSTPKQKALATDLTTCPEPDTWGLTFDDGPNCTHNGFYDFLQQNNLKATMFYIGSNVLNNPLQAQRGIVDGHDICVHTWSHHYTTTLSNEQVFAELYYTAKVIKKVLGITPTCWRPPFGDVDDRVRAIAFGLGLRTIVWQEDTDDWEIEPSGHASTQKIDSNYQSIFSKSSTESPIVLTHELVSQTMDEFQKMFPDLKKAYKNVVPLTACQNISKPYPDSPISYPIYNDFVSGKVNATNLPDGNTLRPNVTASYTPVPLNKTTTGYGLPQPGPNTGGSGALGPSRNANGSPPPSSGSSP